MALALLIVMWLRGRRTRIVRRSRDRGPRGVAQRGIVFAVSDAISGEVAS